MTRIKPVEPSGAHVKSRELLVVAKKQMGSVPNIFKGFANSPAVLDFYLAQSKALADGDLDPKLREQIAVTLAGINRCDYCASAHTFLGRKAGISSSELAANLDSRSEEVKTGTALRFARAVADTRGRIDDKDLRLVRDAGFSAGEIVEIIAHAGMNLFTTYFNNTARTGIDFPHVDTTRRASAA